MERLKVLIVEDEFLSRQLLMGIVAEFGQADVAVDGEEAVRAFKLSYESGQPYDLVFLDIMLPTKNGKDALREMREYEEARGVMAADGVKVVMTTALSDSRTVMESFRYQCDAYVTKPYNRKTIAEELVKLGLL